MQKVNTTQDKQCHILIDSQPVSKKFLGVEYDSLTLLSGFLVPLLSFFFGFIFSIARDRFKERKNIKTYSDTLFIWIKRTIKSASTLLEEVAKKRDEIKELQNFKIQTPTRVNLHLSQLSVDQEKMYNAFVKYRKDEELNNSDDYATLIINLNFLADFQNMLYKNTEHMIDNLKDLFIQWNNYLRDFHKAKHNLIGKRMSLESPSPLLSVNMIFNRWYSQKHDKGLVSTIDFLVELEPFLSEMYSKNHSDDEVENLLFLTQQIKLVYKQFIYERDEYAILLTSGYEQLNETIGTIKLVSDRIEKKKFVLI
jgi:hypothetical protein